MTPSSELARLFAQPLPQITPPVSLADAEAAHEAENGLFCEESNDEQ